MVNNQENNSGYNFLSVVLLKSNFNRITSVANNPNNVDSDLQIGYNNQVEGDLINIIVELIFTAKNKDTKIEEIKAEITMAGKFKQIGKPKLGVEEFVKYNAPAMIFPFVREHLSSLSVKGGIHPIILPPINFVELEKEES